MASVLSRLGVVVALGVVGVSCIGRGSDVTEGQSSPAGQQEVVSEIKLAEVIVLEAAGESFEGKVAVAEVLREHGWSDRRFVGARRADRERFVERQGAGVFDEALRAIRVAQNGSQVARGATHFESTDFPEPVWVEGMIETARIGKHVFYRERD